MLILLFFDFLGFCTSLIAQGCLLLGLIIPSSKISLILNIGLGLVIFARVVITKELRQENHLYRDKSLKNLGPMWLKILIGIIGVYGVTFCLYYFKKFFSEVLITPHDKPEVLRKLFISVFSLLLACYAIEYLMLYLYKLRKAQIRSLKTDDVIIRSL